MGMDGILYIPRWKIFMLEMIFYDCQQKEIVNGFITIIMNNARLEKSSHSRKSNNLDVVRELPEKALIVGKYRL